MYLADIKNELDHTIAASNDLYRTRLLVRAFAVDDLPDDEVKLAHLQKCYDDLCTALADIIKTAEEEEKK